jgi:hypothetical protein
LKTIPRRHWRMSALLNGLWINFNQVERLSPGYLIVGTKRGGTTSLAEWVDQHPDVAPCLHGKGARYFDVNYDRGLDWYLSRFERKKPPWRITGEASPYYMYHPAAISRIAEVLPHVKLIAVLRDPVARAWSEYRYEMARGHEKETFERALDLEDARISPDRAFLQQDPTYAAFSYRHFSYLARGHYAQQIDHMRQYFPREQILILQSERLFSDPQGQLSRVWSFLGLEGVTLKGLEPRNANATNDAIGRTCLRRLQEYYLPLNERLYEDPDVDFKWEYVPGDA